MQPFIFGQIVLLGFPHTDGSSISKRPALILSDTNDQDVILCRITSQFYRTEFDIGIKPSIANGLLVDSVIRVNKIATITKNSVLPSIGRIEQSEKSDVFNTFILLVQKENPTFSGRNLRPENVGNIQNILLLLLRNKVLQCYQAF
ncbi:MAG: type II toxin-antitoxin system PemK/MazF family toxin [Bacteroidota bacterium]